MSRKSDAAAAAQALVDTAAYAAGASLGTGPAATAAGDQLDTARQGTVQAGTTPEQIAQAFARRA